VPSTPVAPMRGDGGLYSTIEDYSRFVACCSTAAPEREEDPDRELGEDDGRERHRKIVVELQPDADKQRTKPFPLALEKTVRPRLSDRGQDPATKGFRSPGSMSWAGIFNTEFWVAGEARRRGAHDAAAAVLRDGAIRTLARFERDRLSKNLQ